MVTHVLHIAHNDFILSINSLNQFNPLAMTFETYLLLAKIQTYLSAVLALLCFYRYKSRAFYIRLIGFTFLLGFVADLSTLFLGKLKTFGYPVQAYYNFPSSIWNICNVALMAAVYYFLLGKKNKLIFISIAGVFLVLASANLLLYQKQANNSYSTVLQALIQIVFCILYFYKLLRELPEQHIHRLPMFWINSALLIFYSGTFILYTFTAYLINVLKNDLITYWSFHNILRILFQLLVMIGLYYDLRRIKKVKPTL